MSREQSPQQESPFGYQLRELQNEVGIPGSLEPSGPPLLNHNETNLLDQFFHDPNDLAADLFGKDFSGGADWAFGPRYGWDNSDLPVTNSQRNGGHLSAVLSSAEYLSSDPTQRAPDERTFLPTSQEVYAAAASLVPNGNAIQGRSSIGNLGYPIQEPGQDINQFHTNGFSNGQLQASQYPVQATSSYNPLNQSYAPQGSNNWQSSERPAPPIRFGTDNNFRSSSYAPETRPTRTVSDTFLAQLELSETQDYYQNTQPSSPTVPKSAQRNGSEDSKSNALQSDADGSADDEDSFSRKRSRKRKIDEDQEDEYDYSPQHKSKSGKSGNQRSGSGKTPRGKNPAKQRNYSSSATKPARENLSEKQKRENHIMSEQKRRNLIKKGYDSLERLVPELRQGGLSKSQILEETAAFMEKLRKDNDELKQLLENG